jgi:ArsR family transcriptional regulator
MARTAAKRPSTNGKAPNPARAATKRLDTAVRDLSQVFKLLSDESRLRLLYLLAAHDELNVTALCEHLGQTQPAVSHHLALLRVAGLIEARREGKHNFYALRPDTFHDLVLRLLSAAGPLPRKLQLGRLTLACARD